MKSIYTKLFILFTVIGIIPLILGSFYFYSKSHQELLNKGLREQEIEVVTGNRNIVTFFVQLDTAMSLIAQKRVIMDYSEEPERAKDHRKDQESALRQLIAVWPGLIESAGFADRYGKVISLERQEGWTASAYQDSSIAEKDYFRQALTMPEGAVYWGIPEYSMATKNMVIPGSTPIFDKDKKLCGVLYIRTSLHGVTGSFRNIAHFEDTIMVVDNLGRLISHSEKMIKDTLPPAYIPSNHPSYRKAIQEMMMGADGSARIFYMGQYYYLTYRNVPADVYNQNRWSLGIMTSEETIYGELSLKRYLLILFPASFFLIAVALLLGWRISHPIKELTEASAAMKHGNLDARASVKRQDEIGLLALTFNEMAHSIQSSHEELLKLSTTDWLTGLYNHMEFQKRIEGEIQRAERHGRILSLLIMDIDNFKNFNDTYGHQFGDSVLHLIGNTLLNQIRSADVATRYGGEEFAIILPETDSHAAFALAERIRNKIQGLDILVQKNEHAHVTVSIGISTYPEDASSREDLIDTADQALYFAKEEGKNRTVIYVETIKASFERRPQEFKSLLEKAEEWLFSDLVTATEARMPFARGHSKAASRLSLMIAENLHLSEKEKKDLKMATLLHDIGTLYVPAEILKKPEPLTEEDWKIIRAHPEQGGKLLGNLFNLKGVLPAILHHHERYDGTGYPKGLKGEEIPLLSRIISVIDAYIAMTTATPYRKKKSKEEAIEELRSHAGTQFDPAIVEVFIRIIEKADHPLYNKE